MNAKHLGKGTKYNGSLTVKKHTLRWDTKNVAKNRQQIRSRTYKRIRISNTRIHGGGGKTPEAKEAEKAAKEAEKAAKADAQRILDEEKANQKAKKKAEEEQSKLDKKAAAKAEKEAKVTAAADNPSAKKTEPVMAAVNNTKPVPTNKLIEGVTTTETNTEPVAKVLTLEPPGGQTPGGPTKTDVDAELGNEAPAAANTNTNTNGSAEPDNKPEEDVENKQGRWASFKETLKKGKNAATGYITQKAKNLGKGIQNVAWGDENTGKLGKVGKLLISPFSLPAAGLYNATTGIYKSGKEAKTRIGLALNNFNFPPESLRLGKKWNNWRKTGKAAVGETKRQQYKTRYDDKFRELADIDAQIQKMTGSSKPEDIKKLNELMSKQKSAEKEINYLDVKNAEWIERSNKRTSKLQAFQASQISASNKRKIDTNIQRQQRAFESNKQQKEKTARAAAKTEINTIINKDPVIKQKIATLTADINALDNNLSPEDRAAKIKQITDTYTQNINTERNKLLEIKRRELETKKELELQNSIRADQYKIYNSQITKISEKLGVNIDAENPQLKAVLEQHHANPNAKPLTGDELIKKVSEVGFSNIVANKQTMTQAGKYLSAPQAMFKQGDKEAAIATLGNNSAKQSFYKEYVRDAKQKLDAKLKELPKGANNAKVKMELARLKAKLDIMDKDKRFNGAQRDEYLYNLLKSNEELLGISTTKKVKEASNAKQALAVNKTGNQTKLETAVTAYYNARTKNLGTEGLEKLAAIYNPNLKTYLSSKKIRASEQDKLVKVGLDKFRTHIKELLQKNPLALKVENPTIYNKIFNPQNSIPSTANTNVTTNVTTIQSSSGVQKTNNKSKPSLNNVTKEEFSKILFNSYKLIYELIDTNKTQIFKTYTNINNYLQSEYNQVLYTKFTTENERSINDKIFKSLLNETWLNYQDCLKKTDKQKKDTIFGNKYTCDFFNDKTKEFKDGDIRYIIRNALMNYYISPSDIPQEKQYDFNTVTKINDELLTIIQGLE